MTMTATTTKKRSERDDFLMHYTMQKDIERRIKERQESQKKTPVYAENTNSQTVSPPPDKKQP